MQERLYIAGHNGMVGSAIKKFVESKYPDWALLTRDRKDLDLLDACAVREFLQQERPTCILIAAAKVGGIYANNAFPADFIFQNLAITTNLINEAHNADVNKILFLGSSCIYPKFALQPIKEDYLLDGYLEPTNEPYAIAKIAGIKICESYNRQYGRDYRSIMPTNVYGPRDNFDLQTSHVVPALLRRFHFAKLQSEKFVEVWGTGNARREFIHVDDLASAAAHVLTVKRDKLDSVTSEMVSHVNIGTGKDISIGDLARLIAEITGYKGEVVFDATKPDGTPRKQLDISRITELGWSHSISLRDGLQKTYSWLKSQDRKSFLRTSP